MNEVHFLLISTKSSKNVLRHNNPSVNAPPPISNFPAQTSPDRLRLNSPVTLVQWSSSVDEVTGGNKDTSVISATGVSHLNKQSKLNRGHQRPSSAGVVESVLKQEERAAENSARFPCVVEYTAVNSPAGKLEVGGGAGRNCARKIRCRRVVVTVGLGVLKVAKCYIILSL